MEIIGGILLTIGGIAMARASMHPAEARPLAPLEADESHRVHHRRERIEASLAGVTADERLATASA